ncbi:MAG: hypothetical protein H0W66_02460 [Chthoniobacterales bacterium]|nr:hypothetical protein [Chthoniobacterales bacterium]
MQLPSGPSSIDTAPVFEISSVQLAAGNDLGLIQLARSERLKLCDSSLGRTDKI